MKRSLTMPLRFFAATFLGAALFAAPALAGWADVLDKVQQQIPAQPTGSSGAASLGVGLSDTDITKGLK